MKNSIVAMRCEDTAEVPETKRGSRDIFSSDERLPETVLRRDAASPSNIYKIQKAIRYIDDNYRSKIYQSVVAKEACMSIYHFSRMFKKVTGRTYRGYFKNLRIEKAKELLEKDRGTITDVSLYVGYADLRHFERDFKKAMGTTPSHHRALLSAEKKQNKPHKLAKSA